MIRLAVSLVLCAWTFVTRIKSVKVPAESSDLTLPTRGYLREDNVVRDGIDGKSRLVV